MISTARKIQAGVFLSFVFSLLIWFSYPMLSHGQGQTQGTAPPSPATWRTNKPFAEAGYVGSEACAKCHGEITAKQHETAMGHALETVAESRVLRSHARFAFRIGSYSYQITRQGEQSIYSVTDGINTITEPVLYSFGQGKAGQTYVLRRGSNFYESRVSYYREIDGLDITLGYPRTAPPSLEEAFGRQISMDETRSCFACHSTAAVSGKNLQLDHLMPGVRCEACHGPGKDHIAAMEAKKFNDKRIFNPGKLSADELAQEFCGSCHRSAETVIEMNMLNINNVRFQPYRTFTSTGHDANDERLSCIACHDPHDNPRTSIVFYDSKCFSCHQSAASLKSSRVARAEQAEGRKDKACPVGTQNCVSCHMPKVELPGSHFKFTDHRIRIAKPGEPFPN
jgi:Zn finger protein HypA/HybF involved in hydrogenase expression